MTAAQLRQSFLDFFIEKKHTIVPSASLMPQSPGLLFTNAGMNQFVPYFLGVMNAPWNPARAADTQKCIRAGGKHNDLEDVGLDSYHHTFFEMMGNWSFGDYFKQEAISWAWELIVERWGFPAERLYATIYAPSKGDPGIFDQDAYDIWEALFLKKGLDPKVHIVHGNAKDNFWMMGDTGPCGPCSELHVDLTPEGDTMGALVNGTSDKCMEIWNLVFIQYNAESDGTFRPLPTCHVDTGMGFERAVAMMQGTKNFTDFSGRISNYNTDVFRPLFSKLEAISGKSYVDIYPEDANDQQQETLRESIAFRVIADHIRTLSFSIADGILPGNGGRNYVLRRILRRAVRYGRTLGLKKEPFLFQLVDTLVAEMSPCYPELAARCESIKEVLLREESSFNETLDRGLELFDKQVAAQGGISGDFAFKLYDTYGFPIDLTSLMAREQGISLDEARFHELMEEQRQRARTAQRKVIVRALDLKSDVTTQFVGASQDECEAEVLEIHEVDGMTFIITDKSPFYAEMGGQVGDIGSLKSGSALIPIIGVQQVGNARGHIISLAGHELPAIGSKISLKLNIPRRRAIEAHHTTTHLLHRALCTLVNNDIAQQGSLVEAERLRFDFSSGAISKSDIRRIEELVNQWIGEDLPLYCNEYSIDEIKQRPEVTQNFGDKYGDRVRLVQVAGNSGDFDGLSMELCGGTHVRRTGEIAFFKIKSEGAVASGIRRIEAACGESGYRLIRDAIEARLPEALLLIQKLKEANNKLRSAGQELVQEPSAANNPDQKAMEAKSISDINAFMDEYFSYLSQLKDANLEADKRLKKSLAAAAASHADALLAEKLSDEPIIIHLEGGNELLTELFNGLRKRHFIEAAFIILDDGVTLSLGAYCGKEAQARGLKAGELIRNLAPIVGGKGGGKADMARGSGKQRETQQELAEAALKAIS